MSVGDESNVMPVGKSAQILVYKNGDEHDPGTEVFVTRQQFRHWLSFLDFLTERLKLGAIHKLYTMEGSEVRHFRDLENLSRYVAANHKFSQVNYGSRVQKGWSRDHQLRYKDFPGLYSGVSKKEYLSEKMFKPTLKDMWDDSQFDMKRPGQHFPPIENNKNKNRLQVQHVRQRSLSPGSLRSVSPVKDSHNQLAHSHSINTQHSITPVHQHSQNDRQSRSPIAEHHKTDMLGTSNSLLSLPQPVRSKSFDYSNVERMERQQSLEYREKHAEVDHVQPVPEWAKDLQSAVKNLAGVVAKVDAKTATRQHTLDQL